MSGNVTSLLLLSLLLPLPLLLLLEKRWRGFFAFVIMLRHSLVYQRKKTQKETKNQKEILRKYDHS